MDLSAFYVVIFTLFIMLAIGFAVRKAGIVNDGISKALSTAVMKIGQPFLIIGAMLKMEYSTQRLLNGLLVLGLGILFHAFVAILAFVCVLKYKNIDERKISEFAIIFGNCGFIGFPLIESVLGAEGVFYGSFFLASFNVFIWTWGMVILSRKREDIKINPKTMIFNFGTIPCVIGILLLALKVPIPVAIISAASYVGSICTPLSMIITGALIATVSLRELFGDIKVYYISVIRLLIAPALITAITYLLGFDNFVVFMAIVFAMPTASATVMFGELYEIEKKKAATLCGLSSLLSMATMPIFMTCLNAILK